VRTSESICVKTRSMTAPFDWSDWIKLTISKSDLLFAAWSMFLTRSLDSTRFKFLSFCNFSAYKICIETNQMEQSLSICWLEERWCPSPSSWRIWFTWFDSNW
jgi:hypothetical protein